MICEKCGHEQPDDSVFCENCGSKLNMPTKVRCTVCGHEQSGGSFCDVCGKPTEIITDEPPVIEPFTDSTEVEESTDEEGVSEKAAVKKTRLIAGVCCAALGIAAITGAVLFLNSDSKGNKLKADTSIAEEISSDSSEEVEEAAKSVAETTVTTTQITTTTTTTTTAITTTIPEEPVVEDTSDTSDTAWVDEYISEVETFKYEIGSENFNSYLVDINNDSIPEMLLYGGECEKFFTVVDGHINLLNSGYNTNSSSFLSGDYVQHTYTLYNSTDWYNYTCSIIRLNQDGSTEVIDEFGCKDGKYYMGDKPSDVTSVERRMNNLHRSWFMQECMQSAAELETELEKYRKGGTSEKKNVEVIPATELIDMSTSDIRKLIGNDYTVYENHEYDEWGFEPTYAITSDTYFPNTYLYLSGEYLAGDNKVEKTKEFFENDTPIAAIDVLDGGLIGDKAKVGDKYHDMMTLVDSLCGLNTNGVGTLYATGFSIVDGHEVHMYFDHLDELRKLATGHEVVDAYNTDAKCVKATINKDGFPHNNVKKGKVTGDGVAIRVAPYTNATALLNADEGAEIYLESDGAITVNGDRWYQVYAYYYNGVRKTGYIHAEYVQILN